VRIGLLWRAEWDPVPPSGAVVETCRLRGMFAALAELGVAAEPVVFTDESADVVQELLLELDGVLVWVNPIEQGRDRSRLDPSLREAAAKGVFVSAHPDVILRMATKEVLVDTRKLGWGSDTRIYRTSEELRDALSARLAEAGSLVLKQRRGMGGLGVWKLESTDPGSVLVQHAGGDGKREQLPLADFLGRCDAYFDGDSVVVEQPYQARLPEGMIRAYLCHDRVVGFTHQYPRGLMPPGDDDRPTTKLFEPASAPAYTGLRARLEDEWVPQMQQLLGLATESLPVIWDADFLFGQKDAAGADTYVLCEINASSTFAFPELAMPDVARAAIERVRALRAAAS
jgi:hypothetical protein